MVAQNPTKMPKWYGDVLLAVVLAIVAAVAVDIILHPQSGLSDQPIEIGCEFGVMKLATNSKMLLKNSGVLKYRLDNAVLRCLEGPPKKGVILKLSSVVE